MSNTKTSAKPCRAALEAAIEKLKAKNAEYREYQMQRHQEYLDKKDSEHGVCEYDPINLATGNFYYNKDDITIPGRYPLTFTRYYTVMSVFNDPSGVRRKQPPPIY